MSAKQSSYFPNALSGVPSLGCRSGAVFAVFLVIVAVLAGPLVGGLAAQEDVLHEELELVQELEDSIETTALAKQSQNPVGDLVSLPFQNNTIFGFGPGDDVKNVLNIQPVYPVHLSQKWNLINRVILPVVYQPELSPDRGVPPDLGTPATRPSSHRGIQGS